MQKKYQHPAARIRHSNTHEARTPHITQYVEAVEARTDEKLGNDEQKIGAYVTKFANVVDRGDVFMDKMMARVVHESAVKYDELPIHKRSEAADIQQYQRESFAVWVEHLKENRSNYSDDFIYTVIRSLGNMGQFNAKKQYYGKRTPGTLAPYPRLDTEALDETYNVLQLHFAGETIEDDRLAVLAKSGNINKLYSHCVLKKQLVVEVPERAEDVKGEWRTYGECDVDSVMRASDGMPWCLSQSVHALRYTRGGGNLHMFFLEDEETGRLSDRAAACIREDRDGNIREVSGDKVDEKAHNNEPSQRIRDALLETAAEKLATLPRGDTMTHAVAVERLLIAADAARENNQPLSSEQIDAVLGLRRPLQTLDAHWRDARERDPRLVRVRDYAIHHAAHQQYIAQEYGSRVLRLAQGEVGQKDVQHILEHSSIPNLSVLKLLNDAGGSRIVGQYFDTLLAHDVPLDELVQYTHPDVVEEKFEELLDLGASPDVILKRHPVGSTLASRTARLLEAGVDAQAICDQFELAYSRQMLLLPYADILSAHGARFNLDEMMRPQSSYRNIMDNLDQWIGIGGKIDLKFIKSERCYGAQVVKNIDTLLAYGITREQIVELIIDEYSSSIVNDEELVTMLDEQGITKELIVAAILRDTQATVLNFSWLRKEQLAPDLDELSARIHENYTPATIVLLGTLLDAGVKIEGNVIVDIMSVKDNDEWEVAYLESILEYADHKEMTIDLDKLAGQHIRSGYAEISDDAPKLLEAGASIEAVRDACLSVLSSTVDTICESQLTVLEGLDIDRQHMSALTENFFEHADGYQMMRYIRNTSQSASDIVGSLLKTGAFTKFSDSDLLDLPKLIDGGEVIYESEAFMQYLRQKDRDGLLDMESVSRLPGHVLRSMIIYDLVSGEYASYLEREGYLTEAIAQELKELNELKELEWQEGASI